MPRTIQEPIDPKKDIYRIITRDQCRDLRVHRPQDIIGEFSENEWRSIKRLADITEVRQKKEEDRCRAEVRKKMEDDFNNRKTKFERMEAEQDFDSRKQERNKEKEEKSLELKAQVEKDNLENENTIRFFNDCLNGVLVRAVRDRQVHRNEQIKQLTAQEQFRLDNACQKDANLGFQISRRLEEHRHQENQKYGVLLKDQLRVKEEERMMDKEQRAAEGRLAQEYARQLQHEEIEECFKKRVEQREATRKLIEANNKALEAKKEAKLHEIRMDHVLAEHQRENLAKEELKEKEAKERRKQIDLEHCLALSKQQRATDIKAIEDEKKAQRAVFQADRDWRLKEISKALKQQREQAELKQVIEYQRETKIRKNAHELEEERKIFKETQDRLVREAAKAEEGRNLMNSKCRLAAETLRKQIAEREKERWATVQNNWNEGKKIKHDQKLLDEKVAAYMKKKMDKAEAANIPRAFLSDIVRHMTVNGYLPKSEDPYQKVNNKDQVSKLIRHFS